MMKRRKIFLVGFMGSGKTTVGRALAACMCREFIDLDDLIVERAGRSITEIFSEFGESHFRKLEQEALRALATHPPAVVALGGGAFVSDENRAIVAKQGFVVWLDCALETIIKRLGNESTRPLYSGRSPDEIAELLAARIPAYAKAHLRLNVTNLSVSEAVASLLTFLPK